MTKTKSDALKAGEKLLKSISAIEKDGFPYSQFTFSGHPLVNQLVQVSDRVKNPELKNELIEYAAKILLMGSIICNQKSNTL